MSIEAFRRFEEEFAPRIAAKLASQLGPSVHIDIVPYEGHGHPTRVRLRGLANEHRHTYSYPLNVSLTWDIDEIQRNPIGKIQRTDFVPPKEPDGWQRVIQPAQPPAGQPTSQPRVIRNQSPN